MIFEIIRSAYDGLGVTNVLDFYSLLRVLVIHKIAEDILFEPSL